MANPCLPLSALHRSIKVIILKEPRFGTLIYKIIYISKTGLKRRIKVIKLAQVASKSVLSHRSQTISLAW